MSIKPNREYTLDVMADWKQSIISEIIGLGLAVDASLSGEDLFLQLAQFKRRLVEKRPRQLLEANAFTCPTNLRNKYELFKQKVMSGESLVGHLSTRIDNLKTRDDLINDWGIHHFHLGENPDSTNPKFMERTGDLLLAVVRPDNFYSIGFWHHKFADEQMLKIIHDNWPELIERGRLNGVVGIEQTHTAAELQQLRSAGILTIQMVGNAAYFSPGGGYSSTRDNINDVGSLNQIVHVLKRIPDLLEQRQDTWLERVRMAGYVPPYELKMEVFDLHFPQFREIKSGLVFKMQTW